MDWSELRYRLDRIGTVLSVIWVAILIAFVWWWYPWATSLVVIALLATYAIGHWHTNREGRSIARAARRHPAALDIARKATQRHLHELVSQMRDTVHYDGRDYDFRPWLPWRDRFIAATILPALEPHTRVEAANAQMPLHKALAGVVDEVVTTAFWQPANLGP